MLILILFLIVGGLMAFFAQYNLAPVTLNLLYVQFNDIPLFYVIIASILVGLGIGYISYFIHSIFSAYTIHGKDNALKQKNDEVLELTKRVHQLELENAHLKKGASQKTIQEKSL